MCPADSRRAGGSHAPAFLLESLESLEPPVHDVLFLLLIAAVFGFLTLCAKGAEKL